MIPPRGGEKKDDILTNCLSNSGPTWSALLAPSMARPSLAKAVLLHCASNIDVVTMGRFSAETLNSLAQHVGAGSSERSRFSRLDSWLDLTLSIIWDSLWDQVPRRWIFLFFLCLATSVLFGDLLRSSCVLPRFKVLDCCVYPFFFRLVFLSSLIYFAFLPLFNLRYIVLMI